MNVSRISRLLRVLQLLQSGNGMNILGLAKECEVSRRTAFRDIKALREVGVPISFDADRDRYAIPGSHFLPPLNLTDEEAIALVTLAAELGRSDRLPFYEAARSAAVKLERILPGVLKDRLGKISRTIHINPGPVCQHPRSERTFRVLLDARAGQREVRFRYALSADSALLKVRFHTYHLAFRDRRWHAIGYSATERRVRSFELNRIKLPRETEIEYVIPQTFNFNGFIGNKWSLSTKSNEDFNVVIRLEPASAMNVAEVEWHKTQLLEFQDDSSLILHLTVSGLEEVASWVLGLGGDAEVLEPSELRDLVSQKAEEIVSIYAAPFQFRPRLNVESPT